MCLVTYIPTATGYILSSNRDEQADRAETDMVHETIGRHTITYPRDKMGGSWIFASDTGHNIVLLNGAFDLHTRKLPYRMSRGLMLKAYYSFDSTADFLEKFDFRGIEPFTIVLVEPKCFIEFRWDGKSKYIATLDKTKPHIWSSATLYDSQMRAERELVFQNLVAGKIFNLALAKSIHNHTDDVPIEYGFIMSRFGRVSTISTTHLSVNAGVTALDYLNRMD